MIQTLGRFRKSCLKDASRGKTASQEYALKKIFFDEVMVREYPRILGDNPAVSDGKAWNNLSTTRSNKIE